MLLKSKMATVVSAVTLMGAVHASSPTPPEACPNIAAIQSAGFSVTKQIVPLSYVSANKSAYDTSSDWVFFVGPVRAMSVESAAGKINTILTATTGSPTPKQLNPLDIWSCEYNTGDPQVLAVALEGRNDSSYSSISEFLAYRGK